jgi:hypothetical protein
MPAHNNRGIVMTRDVTRTAVAMKQLIKHARNIRRAVFSMWSVPPQKIEKPFSASSVPRSYKKDKEDYLRQLSFETPAC